MPEVISSDTPQSIEDLDAQIQKLREQRKAVRKAQKVAKPPVYNSLYRCEGCNCPGFIGRAGGSIRCEAHAKPLSPKAVCKEEKTWRIGGHRTKSEELETLEDASLEDGDDLGLSESELESLDLTQIEDNGVLVPS